MSASVNCRVGDEIEVTYKLDYKMAEVARLPDAAEYTHVATSVGVEATEPGPELKKLFSVVCEHVKVTEDDQAIRFVTRSTGMPGADDEVFAIPVMAWFSNGTRIAAGEKPVEVASVMVKRPAK